MLAQAAEGRLSVGGGDNTRATSVTLPPRLPDVGTPPSELRINKPPIPIPPSHLYTKTMKHILFLNHYDPKNPRGGGAELYSMEVLKRFVRDGYKVTWLAERFNGSEEMDEIDGVKIMRKGNRIVLLWHAFRYYLTQKKNIDLVIDNFHGYPFLTSLYITKEKRISLIHEVAGPLIWNTLYSFPINKIGILIEDFILRVLYRQDTFITVSKSSKEDLSRFGISRVHIVLNGLKRGNKNLRKVSKNKFQLIYFGGLRLVMGGKKSIKNIEDMIYSVKILSKKTESVKLIITGKRKGAYYEKLQNLVNSLGLEKHVLFPGFVPDDELEKLIAESYLTVGTSLKEGWGNMVTEGMYLGTPPVCYTVNGYKDIITHKENGILVSPNTPEVLAKEIEQVWRNTYLYDQIRLGGIAFSESLDWEKTYTDFKKVLVTKKMV